MFNRVAVFIPWGRVGLDVSNKLFKQLLHYVEF